MKYFDNYKTVDLDMLKKSGIYTEQILAAIENKDYLALAEDTLISKEQRQDVEFMGPIVYAFEKAHGTYVVYKYCGDELQKNLEFARDIIKKEPEIIANTAASADREFIEKVVPEAPEVIKHMASELKSDSTFTAELCELNIPEVSAYAAQECKMPDAIEENPTLAENKDFMLGLIQQDANSLEYASDELKNNYNFIKEVCIENKEAIKYVSEHTEEFGSDSLKGAQEVLAEQFNGQLVQDCNDEVEKIKKEIEDKKQQGIEVEPKLENKMRILEKRPERMKVWIEKIKEGDPKRNKVC